MSGLRFLSNTYNPSLPDARLHLCPSYESRHDPKIAEREWRSHLQWIGENIVGEPQETDKYTVEQLKEMGLIGIYRIITDRRSAIEHTRRKFANVIA